MSKHLEREIETLKCNLLTMGTAAENAVASAFEAVSTRNYALAERVVADDARIDEWEIEIEEECLKMLALYRPDGDDLRFVVTALKMNAELERMADLAANIAGTCKFIAKQPELKLPQHLSTMADIVKEMVEKIIRSLVRRDAKSAMEVIADEQKIDALHVRTYEMAEKTMEKEPACARQWLTIVAVSKQLERIADHAMNIGEDVIYLLTGEIVRHRVGEYIAKSKSAGKSKK